MRILMICQDVQIDRRILAEAETLIEQGHEVILLANPDPSLPEHEIIGNVKVERFTAPYYGPREQLISDGAQVVQKGIAKVFRLKQRIVAKIHNLFRLGVGVISKLHYLVQVAIYKAQRLLQWFVSLFERGAVKLSLNLRAIPVYEMRLLERIQFYRPDCIHVHDLPQLRLGALAKRELKVPLIYDAHELYPEIHTLTPAQQQELTEREKRYAPEADAVITVNPFIAEEMSKRYQIPIPHVLLNALNPPPNFDPSARHDRFRGVLPIPPDEKILLYQGWIAKFRGLVPLVEAMPKVDRHVHLVFMGYGVDKEELRRRTEELNVTDRVHFLDAVPQSELLYWSASADAGIIPYLPVDLNNYYSSPNKLFEYVQAGLPVIANDLPFLRKVVHENGFGHVHSFDSPESFAEAINQFFSDGIFPETCRQNILSLQRDFSWTAESRKLIELYSQIFPEMSNPIEKAASCAHAA